ncbi:TPA: DUF262 domain-containing protein [Pseudomonas aeruginosa]|nr:DUF262 domain-containing protein [Pseudomonas aeruginosa]
MATVVPQHKNVKQCFQSHYSLPYFQREYKWEPRHLEEFTSDIQEAFLDNYDQKDGRAAVSQYSSYFLGSIITAPDQDGKIPLIDGQQRLTSIFILMAYLYRYIEDNKISDAANLSDLLWNLNYGVKDYTIEFSPVRKDIFDKYLNTKKLGAAALKDAEDVQDLDESDKKILQALRSLESLIDTEVIQALPYFVDYLLGKVSLIDISVGSESEAHKVFVSMNDRGLRLGPIDLLKGQILSKIDLNDDARACNAIWIDKVSKLRADDAEGDSIFIRTLFRAQWADTMRGKNKGDQAGDFDLIGDAYHRWFQDNSAKLQLQNGDDYKKFIEKTISKFADIYRFIKTAEDSLTSGYEEIYYNSARRFSLQSMILLACTGVDDLEADWKHKISQASKLLDLILTSRSIEGKQNNYDNLKEISFQITKDIRGKSKVELDAYVKQEWPRYCAALNGLAGVKYTKADRSDILYYLARISCYIENDFDTANKTEFSVYWQRDRGAKTFDIEHLLKKTYDVTSLPANHGFADAKEYDDRRNLLGALTLLPRARNRSLQDERYSNKLAVYSTENTLAKSFCDGFYQNNPKLTAFLAANPEVQLKAIGDFTSADIDERANVYMAVAKKTWRCPIV